MAKKRACLRPFDWMLAGFFCMLPLLRETSLFVGPANKDPHQSCQSSFSDKFSDNFGFLTQSRKRSGRI